MKTDAPYQHLIGLTEEEATAILKKEGVDFRFMHEAAITHGCDYCDGRVNARMRNGVVVKIHIG
jgi:hypothetical protein